MSSKEQLAEDYLNKSTEYDKWFHNITANDNQTEVVTQWQQNYDKFSKHQTALTVLPANDHNIFLKKITPLNTPALTNVSLEFEFPAIKPNLEKGVDMTSWVNARGLYVIKEFVMKEETKIRFKTNGRYMFVLMQLTGDINRLANNIGYFKCTEKLVADSKISRTLIVPIPLPFTYRPDLSLHVSKFKSISFDISIRNFNEMYVNYGEMSTKSQLYPPICVKTGEALDNNYTTFVMNADSNYLTDAENNPKRDTDSQKQAITTLFKNLAYAGSTTVNSSTDIQEIKIDLSVKGAVAQMLLVVQSIENIATNWTNFGSSSGDDYITNGRLLVDGESINDPLSATYMRTQLPYTLYKNMPNAHIYVIDKYESDSTCKQPTGERIFDVKDKVQWIGTFKKTAVPLRAEVICVYWDTYSSQPF